MGEIIGYWRKPAAVPAVKFSTVGAELNAPADRLLASAGVTSVRLLFDVDARLLTLEPCEPGPLDALYVHRGSHLGKIAAKGYAERCGIPLHVAHELVEHEGRFIAQF